MGKFYISSYYRLGLACLAFVAFPALAGELSVNVSPTTGYVVTDRKTVALPPRATSGPVAPYNPSVGPLPGGGAYQTTSTGITIEGIRGGGGSTNMSGRINAGANAMKNAMKRCLTSFRCNFALAAGAAGLDALLDGIDWIIEEGSQPVVRKRRGNDPSLVYPPPPEVPGLISSPSRLEFSNMCAGAYGTGGNIITQRLSNGQCYSCPVTGPSSTVFYGYTYTSTANRCWYGPVAGAPTFDPNWASYPPSAPLTADQISSGVDSHYSPDPSDFRFLSAALDFSAPDVNFEILDIPSITGSDTETYVEYGDGTSVGTFSQYDFSWLYNPSKQPRVDVQESTIQITYSPTGDVTNTTTTVTNISGSSATPNVEVPTDCNFMPTVCRFIEWFTAPDPAEEPDLSKLISDIEIERDFSVGSETASCPAPFKIPLSWFGEVEVSLDPFCNLADALRPLLLALAFVYSGLLILRT